MIIAEDSHYYLYLAPTDMRKSIDTLCVVVSETLAMEPASGHCFIFCNRQRNKMKMLYYEHQCFTLWYRRAEKGQFVFPKERDGMVTLSQSQWEWLIRSNQYRLLGSAVPDCSLVT